MSTSGESSYSLTAEWTGEFKHSEKESEPATVLNKGESVEQTESVTCGPAVLASVINAYQDRAGESKLRDIDVAEVVSGKLERLNLTIKEEGTPVELLKEILEEYNVPYFEKVGDPNFTDPEILSKAQKELEEMLKNGYNCIICMQTFPEIMLGNVETGERLPDSYVSLEDTGTKYKYLFIHRNGTVDFEKGDDGRPYTSAGDSFFNGHYVNVKGMMTDSHGKEFYIVDDPAVHSNQREKGEARLKKGEPQLIDPQMYGTYFIEKSVFMRNWHDESIDKKTQYNQYALGVLVGQVPE